MADHAEANPSKGAGKTPRVSRASARRTSTVIPKTSASCANIPETRSIPVKRKSLSREAPELRSPKARRVESRSSTSDSHRNLPNSVTEKKNKKRSRSRADTSSSTSTRELRKRKVEPEVAARGQNSSSESEEELVTTDRAKKSWSSAAPPKEETLSLNSGTSTKTSSKANKSAGHPASSSASAASGGGGATSSGRHSSRNPSNQNSSATSVQNSRSAKAGKNKSKTTSGAPGTAPSTTSEEETKAESAPVQNIASRLRLTPSRAAAAASLQKSLASSSASGTSLETSTNPSSPTFNVNKNKSTRSNKHFKLSKKKQGAPAPKDSSSSVPATTTATSATTDTDDQEDSSAPGSSTNLRAPYQLRSRHSVDSTNSNSSATSKGKSGKDKSSSQTGLASTLRSAHILSEKEKNLKKKSTPPASAAAASTSSTANRPSTSASGSGAALTRSGRVTSTSAKSSSGTTGTCTSSRCGRGGGPSSSGTSGVPVTGSGKPGEPGMSSTPATSTSGQSSSGAQAPSASSAPAAGTAGAEGPASSSSLSAAAAASAFSRGLAMLTGDSDGDEGEMGRLQALLEARGLPPHLFGSLAPRMQQLLNRGMSSSTVSKAQQLLQGLQATGDEGQQLQAAIEMCQLLVMGNEDTLAGFPVKQTVPALIALLAMEHNFDMMNHACRALTYMMEALPRSTPVVAEAVPLFLEKLQVIQCMDVAEQSLTALEMLSRRHAKTILQANGVSACLTFLDFFSITAQRAALAVTANCCQGVHLDEFHLVGDSLAFLASRLTQQDRKSVESVCLIFSRLVDSFVTDTKRIEEIASGELLSNVQQLLVVTPPVVSTVTFILVLRMLAQICSRCPNIALKLLEQNIVGTLSSLLLGSANVNTEVIVDEVDLVPRNPQELLEIVTVIGELLPKLPKDGIFMVNTMMTHPHLTCQDAIQWQWRDDRGTWTSYSSFDSRIIEAAHQSGEDEISLTVQARTYTIDFLGMQQINEDSGTARPVQRKLNPFFNPRAPTEPIEKEAADIRSSFLESHPDFALPFLRPLFALLSEANSSSAGPAVRQSCVKTLLRIVHFLEPEALQKTLKPQQVSNNLASMLGSSDLKIVVGAFQLSYLFMEKLQPIYVVHFRREGVFHQISRISSSEVVGPSPIKSEIAALLGMSGLSGAGGIITPAAAVPTPGAALAPVAGPGTLPPPPPPTGLDSNQNASQAVPAGTSLVSPISIPTAEIPLPPNPPGASSVQTEKVEVAMATSVVTEAGSGSSSEGSGKKPSTPISSSETPSTSSSGSSEKKPEMEPSVVLSDPFKRKRSSKRGIPTSTSRRVRQEETPSIGNTGAPTSSTGLRGAAGERREQPSGSGTAVAGSSGTQAPPSSGPSSGRRGAPKGPGFFASLNPSRWTRGSSSSSAGTNNNAPSSSGSTAGVPAAPERPVAVNNNNLSVGGAQGTGGTCPGPAHRGHNSSAYLAVSYKEQVKSWLKEQSLIFSQKYCRAPAESESSSENAEFDSVGILPKLGEIIGDLRKVGIKDEKMLNALKELRTVVLESDISPFEVNHSGLIGALLGFLVDEDGYKTKREQRLRSFIHVFADCPLAELSGEELSDCLAGSSGKPCGLSSLVTKLNSCFSQLEQFQVKVHEVPTTSGGSRAAPSSALRFFNTHQLKCVLQRHPSCSSLRQWKGGPVKIDPLALVQAIERYLIVRGFGRIRESRDSGDSDEDNSDDDIDDSMAAVVISQGATRHKLQFIMNDQVLPYNMTVYQAIRQFGGAGLDPGGDLDSDFIDPSASVLGSSGIWSQTHTIYYRPVSEDGVPAAVPPPVTTKTSSKKSKSASKSSKSKKDPLWHEGIVPVPAAPFVPYLTSRLPDTVTVSDPSIPVLTLLRVIHAISRYWRSLYWPVLPGPSLLPASEFINTKVAAKAQRQLQDPVVIMTGNLPQWLQQIGVACPFLFPFETRQMLFYSISFDRDRALQRLLDNVPELNSTEREDRVTPRLDRRKRTISRDQILAQAEQLMQDFSASRPLLEVQYENEVGTGLGPTLEFYALVSQELQKKELELWHCESSHSIGDEIVDIKSKSYVQSSVGLFPKPLSKSAKATTLAKVKSKFKFIGRFMAKAVMDSRMIDLPLSKAQYKWILGNESSLNLADIADVDPTIAQSIRKLVSVVSAKKKLEQNSGLVGAELNHALEDLTLDGCRIDNLGLDFTLPGHSGIELRKGGKDTSVTIYNLEEYIKLVCHWMLVGGVHRQMESWREGFDIVFPSSALRMFYPEELEMVFCGANQSMDETWDLKALAECCRPDHGFTTESRAMQFLFEILSSYDAQERRQFVQFVTGSPRLPVGGFKALQPPLTIVRKTIDSGDEDSFLPSVMTCVNYLKLPDYSTKEIMSERLRVAADEGQMSFHLS